MKETVNFEGNPISSLGKYKRDNFAYESGKTRMSDFIRGPVANGPTVALRSNVTKSSIYREIHTYSQQLRSILPSQMEKADTYSHKNRMFRSIS